MIKLFVTELKTFETELKISETELKTLETELKIFVTDLKNFDTDLFLDIFVIISGQNYRFSTFFETGTTFFDIVSNIFDIVADFFHHFYKAPDAVSPASGIFTLQTAVLTS
jgi:hypothetical protein